MDIVTIDLIQTRERDRGKDGIRPVKSEHEDDSAGTVLVHIRQHGIVVFIRRSETVEIALLNNQTNSFATDKPFSTVNKRRWGWRGNERRATECTPPSACFAARLRLGEYVRLVGVCG